MKNIGKKLMKIFAVALIAIGTCFTNVNVSANENSVTLRFQTGDANTKNVKIELNTTKDEVVMPQSIDVVERSEDGDFFYTMNPEENTQYAVSAILVDDQEIDMSNYTTNFSLVNELLTLGKEATGVQLEGNQISYLLKEKAVVASAEEEVAEEAEQTAKKSETIVEEEKPALPKQVLNAPVTRSVPDGLKERIDEFNPDFSFLDWQKADLETGNIFGSATNLCVFTFEDFKVISGSEIIGKAAIGGVLDNKGTKPMSQIGHTPGIGNGEAPSWARNNINYIIGKNVIGGFTGGIHGWLASALENEGLDATSTLFREKDEVAGVNFPNTYIYGDYQIDATTKVSNKISNYFTAAKDDLMAVSKEYMNNPLGAVGTVEHTTWGATTFTGKDINFNVFNLSSAQFNGMKAIQIDVPKNSYVQINITDPGNLVFDVDITQSNVLSGNLTTRIDAANDGTTATGIDNMNACSHIFWNMPETTSFTTKTLFPGSLFGPNVDLQVEGVSTNGSIVVNSYTMNNSGGEAHNYPFKFVKNIPDTPITTKEGKIEIKGTKALANTTWNEEVFTIEMKDEAGSVISKQTVNKDAKDFTFTKKYTSADISTTPYHYTISEKNTKTNSIINDTKTYDVYVKVSDSDSDTLKIEMSNEKDKGYQEINSMTLKTGDVAFTNTYFKGAVEIIKTLDGKAFSGDSEAVFNLYSYTSATPTMGDVGNKQVGGDYTTTSGKVTISDLEEGKYFIVEKTAPNGYVKDETLQSFEITADNYTVAKQFTINNVKAEVAALNLKIEGSKTLSGRNFLDSDNFEVELVNGKDVVKSVKIDTDGKFSLDLPTMNKEGVYNYVVREKQPAKDDATNGVTYDKKIYKLDVTVSETDGKYVGTVNVNDKERTINKGVVTLSDTATFTNAYKAKGTVEISGTKVFTGRDWKDDEIFDIEIRDAEGKLLETKEVSNKAPDFTFTRDYTQADAGKTFHYVVSEKQETINGVTFDTTKHDVYIKVSDTSTGALKFETSTDGKNYKETSTIDLGDKAFTNAYKANGTVEISGTKVFTGRDWKDDEIFDIEIRDAEGKLLDTKEVSNKAPDFTFTRDYTQADAGKTFHYVVSEKQETINGVTFDTTKHNVSVKVSDNADGTLKFETSTDDKNYKETSTIDLGDKAFTNAYKANGTVEISGTKVFTGRDWKDDEIFDIEICDAEGKLLETKEVSNKAPDFTFTRDYTQADAGKTFHYVVSEKQETINGVTFDTTKHNVSVKVSDNADGTLKFETSTDGKNYKETSTIDLGDKAFTNTYAANGSLTIKGTKSITGGPWTEEDKFEIVLKDGEEEQIFNINQENKEFTFTKEYTLGDLGTHEYTISEKQGNTNSMIYDNTVYNISVIVSDKKDGTLNVITTINGKTYEGKDIDLGSAFTNEYFKGSVELTKTLDGEAFSGDSEAVFNLYSYTSESPTMEDDGNKQIGGEYTTKNGSLSVSDLEEGKYFFVETKAPSDYVKSDKVYAFAVNKDTYKNTIEISVNNDKQPRGTISIHKSLRETRSRGLVKAIYGIYEDSECKTLLETLTTNASGNATSEKEYLPGTYYVQEITAPLGYTLDETVYDLTIDETGETSLPILYVTDAPTKALISKVNEDGKLIEGAKLQIKDSKGNVVATWTSEDYVYKLSGMLQAGETYTLVELEAPKGYELADEITFEMPLYGDVEKEITMVDKAIKQPEVPELPEIPVKPIVPSQPEEPIKPETPKKDKPKVEEKKKEEKTVETGDFDRIVMYLGMGSLSFLVLAGMGMVSKKKKETNK